MHHFLLNSIFTWMPFSDSFLEAKRLSFLPFFLPFWCFLKSESLAAQPGDQMPVLDLDILQSQLLTAAGYEERNRHNKWTPHHLQLPDRVVLNAKEMIHNLFFHPSIFNATELEALKMNIEEMPPSMNKNRARNSCRGPL